MSEGESSPPRRKRRFLLLVFILLTTGVASYLIFWGGLRLWNASLPADAPRIAMTPDDGWIARLGFTALTYDQIFSRLGGAALGGQQLHVDLAVLEEDDEGIERSEHRPGIIG